MNVAELLRLTDSIAPAAKAAGWDPVGLQVGDPESMVRSVGVCHDVTEAVIDEAVAGGVDALVAYHPLLFRPGRRFVAGNDAAGRAFRLATAGVALVVVHTGFDVAPGGCADALADALNLGDVRGFGPAWTEDAVKIVTFLPSGDADAVADAMAAAGAGTIGAYTACSFRSSGIGAFTAPVDGQPVIGRAGESAQAEEVRLEMIAPARRHDSVVAALLASHPYEQPAFDLYDVRGNSGAIGRYGRLEAEIPLDEFAAQVREQLGGVLRVSGPGSHRIEAVGVVPGSGSSVFASMPPVDVIVTGDVSHHAARDSMARGVAVVDPGHAETERPGLRRLYAAVAAHVSNAVDLTGIDSSPWRGVERDL